MSTASTSSAVSEWSARPVYICWAERGCSVSACAPASARRGPIARKAREPSRWPRRIFTVTGTSTASATASTRRHARSPPSVSISELPAPVFVTLRTGQPMLMSTMSAPASTTMMRGARHPVGLGAEDLHRQRPLVARDPQVAVRALVAVVEAAGGDHLRAHQAGAEAASLAAEGLRGNARHRRQHDPARDQDVADRPRVGEGSYGGRHGSQAIIRPDDGARWRRSTLRLFEVVKWLRKSSSPVKGSRS